MRKTLSSIAVAGIAILAVTGTAAGRDHAGAVAFGRLHGQQLDGREDAGRRALRHLRRRWRGRWQRDVEGRERPAAQGRDGLLVHVQLQAGRERPSGAAPYARIWLDKDGDGQADHTVILDPSNCATQTPEQSKDLTRNMVDGPVRYGDDGCGDPDLDGGEYGQQAWEHVVGNHGDEKIVNVTVTQGWSTGTDVSAMLRQITFNGKTYAFNVAPADGQAGAAAQNGRNGAPGLNGATGAAGQNGTTTVITREVPAHGPAKVCARQQRPRPARVVAEGRAVPVGPRVAERQGPEGLRPQDHGRPAPPRRGQLQRPHLQPLPHGRRQGPHDAHGAQPERGLLLARDRPAARPSAHGTSKAPAASALPGPFSCGAAAVVAGSPRLAYSPSS